jgi:Copper amine oxidase N-terminal domain
MDKKRSLLPRAGTVLATGILAAIAAVLVYVSQPASLRIDGQKITSDVPPVTSVKGEAFVPLRVVAENLGAETNYDPKTGTIELIRTDGTLKMHLGDKMALMNGKRVELRYAPFSVRGRTMVYLGTITRAFGSHVSYDRSKRKIEVRTPGMVEAGAQENAE